MTFLQINLVDITFGWVVFLAVFSAYMAVFGLIKGRIYWFGQWIDQGHAKGQFMQIELGYAVLFLFCVSEMTGQGL